jgi:hypothetical protein
VAGHVASIGTDVEEERAGAPVLVQAAAAAVLGAGAPRVGAQGGCRLLGLTGRDLG